MFVSLLLWLTTDPVSIKMTYPYTEREHTKEIKRGRAEYRCHRKRTHGGVTCDTSN